MGGETAGEASATDEGKEGIFLEDESTRSKYLDDLFELEAFLSQRIREEALMASLGGEMAVALKQSERMTEQIKATTSSDLRRMLDAVQNAMKELMSPRAQQILSLKLSSRYLERVARSMHDKRRIVSKMLGIHVHFRPGRCHFIQVFFFRPIGISSLSRMRGKRLNRRSSWRDSVSLIAKFVYGGSFSERLRTSYIPRTPIPEAGCVR